MADRSREVGAEKYPDEFGGRGMLFDIWNGSEDVEVTLAEARIIAAELNRLLKEIDEAAQ